jgi:hypothetical protein
MRCGSGCWSAGIGQVSNGLRVGGLVRRRKVDTPRTVFAAVASGTVITASLAACGPQSTGSACATSSA